MKAFILALGFSLALAFASAGLSQDSGDSASSSVSSLDGVFNQEQLDRAQAIYDQQCAACHGADLSGSASAPQLAGVGFAFYWNGRSVHELFDYTKATMPLTRPGGLSDQEYVDLVALILHANGARMGENELPTDEEVLKEITFATEE